MGNPGTMLYVIERETEPEYSEIREVIQGYFTTIQIDVSSIMFVDEEGIPKKLKRNPDASEVAGMTILGNALLWKRIQRESPESPEATTPEQMTKEFNEKFGKTPGNVA